MEGVQDEPTGFGIAGSGHNIRTNDISPVYAGADTSGSDARGPQDAALAERHSSRHTGLLEFLDVEAFQKSKTMRIEGDFACAEARAFGSLLPALFAVAIQFRRYAKGNDAIIYSRNSL